MNSLSSARLAKLLLADADRTVPISIKNLTRQPVPSVRFDLIKDKILSRKFEVSLVLAGSTTSRRLNKSMRGKDRPTNVLSFPLSLSSGEIFLDLKTIKREQKKFGMSYTKLVTFLFIHGCLHLKGMEHGAKMTKAEQKFLNGATNNSWY